MTVNEVKVTAMPYMVKTGGALPFTTVLSSYYWSDIEYYVFAK